MKAWIVELDNAPVAIAMFLVKATRLAKLLLGHSTQSSVQRSITSGDSTWCGIVQIVVKNLNVGLLFHLLVGPGG